MSGGKVVRNGQVAVLISRGFGAGWSTWNSGDIATRMLFDPALVEAVEAGDFDGAAAIAEAFEGDYVCILGARDLVIRWVDEGTQFIVEEYDGAESLRTNDDTSWTTA